MKKIIFASMCAMALLFSANAQTPAASAPCCKEAKTEAPCCKEAKTCDKKAEGCCKEAKPCDKKSEVCCKEAKPCDKKGEVCCKEAKPCDKKAKGCCKEDKTCGKDAKCTLEPCPVSADAKATKCAKVQTLKTCCPKDTIQVISTETLDK